jgi:hypothetical protein
MLVMRTKAGDKGSAKHKDTLEVPFIFLMRKQRPKLKVIGFRIPD